MGFFKKPAALLPAWRRRKAISKVMADRKEKKARDSQPRGPRIQGVNQSHGAHTGRMKANRKARSRRTTKLAKRMRQRVRRQG